MYKRDSFEIAETRSTDADIDSPLIDETPENPPQKEYVPPDVNAAAHPYNFYGNIQEKGIENDLTGDKAELRDDVRNFLQRATEHFKREMYDTMEHYASIRDRERFPESIQEKMIDRGYDLPKFQLLGGDEAMKFLEKTDFAYRVPKVEGFLVVFQFPAPLARFWYRGGYGSEQKQIPENNIEWGLLYKNVHSAIWEATDIVGQDNNLNFDRINLNGDHSPDYYYIWDVSRPKPEEKFPEEIYEPGRDRILGILERMKDEKLNFDDFFAEDDKK